MGAAILLAIAAALVLACAGPTRALAAEGGEKVLLVLGDSLTAGYGLASPEEEAFPGRLQQAFSKSGLGWRVVAAGLSGDTTAGGLRRIDWLLKRPVHGVIVALGGNDGLRGIAPEATAANLKGIVGKIRAKYPEVRIWIAGMQMPANLGAEYLDAYKNLFPSVAGETGSYLIPFLLDGVGGVPDLNQQDGIHPTAEGHRRIAGTLQRLLEPELRRGLTSRTSSG